MIVTATKPARAGAVRDAATVMLLRDGATGPEVYLLRRVAGMAFASGMHVFPGGTVDPQDYATPIPDRELWAQRLNADTALAGALVSAAVRETFEETGALVGVGWPATEPAELAAGWTATEPAELAAGWPATEPAQLAAGDSAAGSWEQDRLALVRHETTFAEVLTRHDAAVVPDVLHAWSRWITPTGEPRRYDTRFFVSALTDGLEPRHVGGEAQHSGWARVADVADRPMLPPTRVTLAELAQHDSVDRILAAARTRDLAPILPIRRGAKVELPDGRVI